MCYDCVMINGFQHKGLRLFFENDDPSKLPAHHIEKIRRILYKLDEATTVEDMNVIGWALHPLSGNYKGFWSVKVNGNYRIIFKFAESTADDVDYLDYH